MKRGLTISFVILFSLISLSFVSALGTSNFLEKITGKATFSDGCGNGVIERGEQCDGEEPFGSINSCEDFGFVGGSLTCSPNCAFDTSGCVAKPSGFCGDGIVQSSNEEKCDLGDQNGVLCNQPLVGYCTYCNNDCQLEKYFGGSGGTSTSEEFCKDSDGGNNVYVKGTLTDKNDYQTKGSILTHEDFCSTKSTGDYITEFYCSGVYQDSSFISCPNGCVDGACAQAVETVESCKDSDGGRNYGIAGVVKGYDFGSGKSEVLTDFCDSNTGKLWEYWCGTDQGNRWDYAWEEYNCPNGCLNGVCIGDAGNLRCTDSDGGNDVYRRGKTNLAGNDEKDTCQDSVTLYEWSCTEDGLGRSGSPYNCPNGCLEGECVRPSETETCTDSDGGINYDEKGTMHGELSDSNGTRVADWVDYCTSFGQLDEFSCGNGVSGGLSTGSSGWNDLYNCPNGCVDGACVEEQQTIIKPAVCKDSDNGYNPDIKGTITGKSSPFSNEIVEQDDFCIEGQEGYDLIEFQCGYYGEVYYAVPYGHLCPEGCMNGRCAISRAELIIKTVVNFFGIPPSADINKGPEFSSSFSEVGGDGEDLGDGEFRGIECEQPEESIAGGLSCPGNTQEVKGCFVKGSGNDREVCKGCQNTINKVKVPKCVVSKCNSGYNGPGCGTGKSGGDDTGSIGGGSSAGGPSSDSSDEGSSNGGGGGGSLGASGCPTIGDGSWENFLVGVENYGIDGLCSGEIKTESLNGEKTYVCCPSNAQ